MHIRMDWSALTFDWNKARAFLATAEEGSLTAAARVLGLTQPTLGRQIEGLEAELGVALFERVGRGLVLTPSGAELLETVRAMGRAAADLSHFASDSSTALEGPVSITCSEIYGMFLLPPIVAGLRRAYPRITLEILASNATLDLRLREADIAIRSYRPSEEALVALKIGEDEAQFYATRDYLNRIGRPKRFVDLAGADFIGIGQGSVGEMIAHLNTMGLPLSPANFPVIAGDHPTHWELTKQGVGIGIVPVRIGDADPAVVRAVPDAPPMTFPIWLATHRELKTSARVRAVFDYLADALGRLASS